ncbi:hypothetical protein NSA33_02435 [Mammaliicoccus lentus]|uniref:hypothetical protein n=1 Tax=Mammaliicoccus lentus TaxID=42858 RepID=UPI00214D0929|nr:hypothetical protein [Mammaliicoccus lentus]MCR1872007.1 hypothetical protein [Mammaliicoccus lentus]
MNKFVQIVVFVITIPFLIVIKILSFMMFFLVSTILYPLKYFMINIRDIVFGKTNILYWDEHDKYYYAPLITYYFSSFPFLLFAIGLSTSIHFDFISEKHSINPKVEIIPYLITVILYVLVFYFAMFRRFKVDNKKIMNKSVLLDILSIHRQFLNLSFIPITFVITIFGIASSLDKPIQLNLLDINNFIDSLYNVALFFNYSDNILFILLGLIIHCIAIFIGLYIFTIPLQLISLFINYVFKYFYEHGRYYKEIFNDFDEKFK